LTSQLTPKYQRWKTTQLTKEKSPCACGCGELATYGNKSIHGHRNKIWFPFDKTREIVRSLNCKSINDYLKLSKEGKLPRSIPAALDQVYKNKGWTNWSDFLGNYYRALQFEKARNIVRGFKCKGMDGYSRLYKQGKLPRGIPYNPAEVYGNKCWMGYPNFLGYEYDQIQRGSALPYNEVKKILIPLKLSGQKEFLELHKQGKLPNGVPRSPKAVYRNKGWNSWPDF
jgi:hypothetical protein